MVGAGSAGAIVAARLSEDPRRSVLLVEAGPDLRAADAPAAVTGLSFNDAKALPDRQWNDTLAVRAPGQPPQRYTRGRGLGGSSVINAMVALRGEPADYDGWEREWGCVGWGWREVAPWFDRIAVPLRRVLPHEHGALNRALLQSGVGAEPAALTQFADRRRASVVDVYLEPARTRANLSVLADAPVDGVLTTAGCAAGVRMLDGTEIEADHVVVAAGAIHSPAILWRSGIDRQGIGHNLHDHAAFPMPLHLHQPADADGLPISALARIDSTAGVHDLQLLAMDHVDRAQPQLGLLIAALMRVHSRGRLVFAADPGVSPQAEFAMLTDERDVVALREGIVAAQRCLGSPAISRAADVLPYDDSDDGIAAALGDYVHAAGSCRMGAVSDDAAVVDVWGSVIGCAGLSVIDASIMPALPRANTHLPTMMIAERLSAALTTRLVAG